MKICPDCGEPLTRLNDRLYFCSNSQLYYLSNRGKLGSPLTEPPASMKETPQPPPQEKPTRQTSIPKNLYVELTNKIGEEQIPNFIMFLKRQMKARPFEFMIQPRRIKDEVLTRAFPQWLEQQGLT